MKVRFFSRNTTTGGVDDDGTITLKGGQLIADPPDSISLKNILAEDVWVHQLNGEPPIIFNSIHHPKEFLQGLPKQYGHGSYFWCSKVED
jgi:hypothetical protein